MHRLSERNIDREDKNKERWYFEEEGEIRKNYAPTGICIYIYISYDKIADDTYRQRRITGIEALSNAR